MDTTQIAYYLVAQSWIAALIIELDVDPPRQAKRDITALIAIARTAMGYESRAALLENDIEGEAAVMEVYEVDGATSEPAAKRLHNRLCAAWWPCTCPWCDGTGGDDQYVWDCGLCNSEGWLPSKTLTKRLEDEQQACA